MKKLLLSLVLAGTLVPNAFGMEKKPSGNVLKIANAFMKQNEKENNKKQNRRSLEFKQYSPTIGAQFPKPIVPEKPVIKQTPPALPPKPQNGNVANNAPVSTSEGMSSEEMQELERLKQLFPFKKNGTPLGLPADQAKKERTSQNSSPVLVQPVPQKPQKTFGGNNKTNESRAIILTDSQSWREEVIIPEKFGSKKSEQIVFNLLPNESKELNLPSEEPEEIIIPAKPEDTKKNEDFGGDNQASNNKAIILTDSQPWHEQVIIPKEEFGNKENEQVIFDLLPNESKKLNLPQEELEEIIIPARNEPVPQNPEENFGGDSQLVADFVTELEQITQESQKKQEAQEKERRSNPLTFDEFNNYYSMKGFYKKAGFSALGLIGLAGILYELSNWLDATPAKRDMALVKKMVTFENLSVDTFDSLAPMFTVVSAEDQEVMRGFIQKGDLATFDAYAHETVIPELKKAHKAVAITDRMKNGAMGRVDQARSLYGSAATKAQAIYGKASRKAKKFYGSAKVKAGDLYGSAAVKTKNLFEKTKNYFKKEAVEAKA